LEFGILHLHRLILLAFSMLNSRVVELIEKAHLIHVIFLDFLLFVGLLANNILLHNPPQKAEYVATAIVAPKFFGWCIS
jgi:hypothetical protein